MTYNIDDLDFTQNARINITSFYMYPLCISTEVAERIKNDTDRANFNATPPIINENVIEE